MRILAIETSCDETSAAVVENTPEGGITILSNMVASSLALHAQTGGIIPEVAARNQSTYILPVIEEALLTADVVDNPKPRPNPLLVGEGKLQGVPDIDAMAITYGPGLIGSLLVGVETVKALSYVWDKPLIPVNHLFGHIYANFICENPKSEIPNSKSVLPEFPIIALIVSGGHTDIVLMKSHQECVWLGGTRDDAAGEAYDKVGRLLGLAYPAGPKIEELAKQGNPNAFSFPRPIKYDKSYDFSFSGLKTAVLRQVASFTSSPLPLEDLCRCTQDAIIDVLVYKTCNAAKQYQAKSIVLSGGVAANQTLRDAFQKALATSDLGETTTLFAPAKNLCTDNAAMIGAAAYFQQTPISWKDITANPELYFD